jgi:cytochrome c oxidase subunit 2
MESLFMKRILSLLVLSSFVIAGCGQTYRNDAIPANAQKVTVLASNWKWTIDRTTFKEGVPIDFHIVGTDGVHGFQIVGTNISQPIAQGRAVDRVWTPDKTGTYTIRCNVYCGAGHTNMFTQFKVSK